MVEPDVFAEELLRRSGMARTVLLVDGLFVGASHAEHLQRLADAPLFIDHLAGGVDLPKRLVGLHAVGAEPENLAMGGDGLAEETLGLRRVDGDFKIANRKIFLEQTVLLSRNLSNFI